MRKRIICMALALMLTLSLAVPALAANVNDYSQIATTFNDQKTVDGPDGYARYSLDDGENALL